MAVYWLDEYDCEDRTRVGGKAANLSRLSKHVAVPPGFCLSPFDPYSALGAEETVELSHGMVQDLTIAYNTLVSSVSDQGFGVAVRSSAFVEDSETATFAGQFQTYLNVVGLDAILVAVKKCWAGTRNPTVMQYCYQRGIEPYQIGLAVLVQQMIVADSSAVVFSVDPVSGGREAVVMNAVWGLGESLVNGRVNPDHYEVARANKEIVAYEIGDKEYITVVVSQDTREVRTPMFLRTQPAFTHTQIQEAAELALTAEAIMGWSVDIECAFRDDKCYLLQCRPITT
jgi:pyruvate,water dikinase